MREKEFTRHLAVVRISGSQGDNDVAKSYDPGARSFPGKTDKSVKFEDTVRQVIPYWLHLNHPYIYPGVSHR